MKLLRFETLNLLSRKEQKARKIEFHPRLTVIKGPNDVGKSSVIKSIYWALGAASGKIHPMWARANIKALLTFTVDNGRYKILRDHDTFGIFGSDNEVLLITNQITRDLAPFFGELLDFNLVLSNRQGKPEVPPPAYAFLPFYIDQDTGWTRPLESFSNLTQYKEFRKPLLEFHTGILPKEYYELEAEKRRLQIEQKELGADQKIVQKALSRLNLEAKFDGLELSVEGHEIAIENLLSRLTDIRALRQDRASKLSEILDRRMIINQQVQIVRASIIELEKDTDFAAKLPEEIYCPTCGTSHDNDFSNRYGIIADREACFDFLTTSKQSENALVLQASKAEAEIKRADHELSIIQASLDEKRGDVSLVEVIESRGRRIASDLFDSQLFELDTQITKLLEIITGINRDLRKYKDKKRRDRIVDYYAKLVLRYLRELDVANYDVDQVSRIPAQISETGSDLPRALLGYYLAILNTIYSYSTSVFAPIVIDSPNQQDQDAENVGSMIDLVIAARPSDAQLILGTVSLHGRSIADGSVIELQEKLSVLRREEYVSVTTSMQPYMDKMVL
ncbi:hypothetical protein E4L95_16580 [Paracoccus liaowanqingii]|uniref:Rad50/SbcC-type AAA domain-containing protein n=1 Tax=Paracoccus liaowanqingii TaxID=2560053 RepID=A0A4Z1BIB8_9RHOB|nr:AAA family ATPase [Paracoccus liaowanqingii]TGN51824.1 hypothetical protein E4L95_16580 [Paracoccus liaowanqingii]